MATVLFNEVRVYDGKSDELSGLVRVYITGDCITAIEPVTRYTN